MAIVKSQIFGPGSKGSIGNITLRTSAGRVIASDKITAKGGLGTRAQVVHQTRMANIMQAYRELSACGNGNAMSQSFPGRARTMSNANMFMRVNMAEPTVSAVVQRKEEAAANALYPAPFIVARGNLPGLAAMQALYSSGSITLTVPQALTISDMGGVSKLLAETFGLREFDTVTFFVMGYAKSLGASAKIDAFQLVIDTASTDDLPTWITYTAGTSADGSLKFTFGTVDTNNGLDIAIVQGRNTASGYEVSDAQFTAGMLSVQPYITVTGNRAEEDAAQSYGYKDNPYLQASTANPQ